ncbi:MAG: hypothetical protein GY850_23485 [bacterium]|nr:hypothetical protein [bacterium]
MGNLLTLPVENHFGDCPKCKNNDGHLNVGQEHWFYCKKHRVKWHVGSNIFPDWHEESAENWQQNEELLGFFMEIEPVQTWKYPRDDSIFFKRRTSGGKLSGPTLLAVD